MLNDGDVDFFFYFVDFLFSFFFSISFNSLFPLFVYYYLTNCVGFFCASAFSKSLEPFSLLPVYYRRSVFYNTHLLHFGKHSFTLKAAQSFHSIEASVEEECDLRVFVRTCRSAWRYAP